VTVERDEPLRTFQVDVPATRHSVVVPRAFLQSGVEYHVEVLAVEAHGNVFAATAFLYGIAVEELDRADLDVDDAAYPVTVAARAVKANVA